MYELALHVIRCMSLNQSLIMFDVISRSLEEDVDEIYRVYGPEQPKQEKDVFELTMEQLLIQEQVDTRKSQ